MVANSRTVSFTKPRERNYFTTAFFRLPEKAEFLQVLLWGINTQFCQLGRALTASACETTMALVEDRVLPRPGGSIWVVPTRRLEILHRLRAA